MRMNKLMEQQYKAQVQAQSQQEREERQMQQQIEALEDMVKVHLSRDALYRYGNLKVAHPERAIQVLVALARTVQAGHIKEKVTDDELKTILRKIAESEGSSRKLRK